MNKNTKIDISVLVALPVIGAVITLLFPVNLMAATLLLFAPPALYLSFRSTQLVARSTVYATIITLISIFTDYLAEQDKSWVSTSMFETRLAGVVPFEALVWIFLLTYLIVAYYQYFYDQNEHKVVAKRMPYAFGAAAAVVVWITVLALTGIGSLTIEYFYIKSGLTFMLPVLILFTIAYLQYFKVYLKMAPYFIAIGLANVLISLHKGHWSYPGENFVGWVTLFGYHFPIEELIFWIVLYAPFIITQFEFFNNDNLLTSRSSRGKRLRT